MKEIRKGLLLSVLLGALFLAMPAQAQEATPPSNTPPLLVVTDYPSQQVARGDIVTLDLDLTGNVDQVASLTTEGVPDGWDVSFRGKNRVVQAVYVHPGETATVSLRVQVAANAEAGEHSLKVVARGNGTKAELPITFVVKEKVPASLSLSTDLPTLLAKPTSTFRFNVDLKNLGDDSLNVDLAAAAPPGFLVTFTSGGQDVTSLPVEGNATKRIVVEVDPLFDELTPTDNYPIRVTASSSDLEATLDLVATVVGSSQLSLQTPDGRLSGDVQAGQDTSVTLLITNQGSAPAHSITMSSTPPTGWNVTFDPADIPELKAGESTQVTVHLQPGDKALAGDYMVTIRAKPQDAGLESVDYRATVRTSTIWGVVGVALIAVAVGVVGLAVSRFGRR